MSVTVLTGDCRARLAELPAESVHMIVTSPPYYGLRDYGTGQWDGGEPGCDHVGMEARTVSGGQGKQYTNAGSNRVFSGDCRCGARRIDRQIGLEATPEAYVAELVAVFRECRRVLRSDGTLWLNLGDSYAGGGGYSPDSPSNINGGSLSAKQDDKSGTKPRGVKVPTGLKAKDLIGIPWRVAFALQADGWWLRQDIIWAKPNPMPESVTDRCTKAHEYLFLLSKSASYFYDAAAVAEPAIRAGDIPGGGHKYAPDSVNDQHTRAGLSKQGPVAETRNRRSVWTVPTQPYSEAHFATFPPALIEPCIKAGTSERGCCAKCGAPRVREVEATQDGRPLRNASKGDAKAMGRAVAGGAYQQWRNDNPSRTTGWSPSCACDAATVPATVLDPFGGAGTTGLVADRLGRNAVLIELNPAYAAMARERIARDAGMFTQVAAE